MWKFSPWNWFSMHICKVFSILLRKYSLFLIFYQYLVKFSGANGKDYKLSGYICTTSRNDAKNTQDKLHWFPRITTSAFVFFKKNQENTIFLVMYCTIQERCLSFCTYNRLKCVNIICEFLRLVLSCLITDACLCVHSNILLHASLLPKNQTYWNWSEYFTNRDHVAEYWQHLFIILLFTFLELPRNWSVTDCKFNRTRLRL